MTPSIPRSNLWDEPNQLRPWDELLLNSSYFSKEGPGLPLQQVGIEKAQKMSKLSCFGVVFLLRGRSEGWAPKAEKVWSECSCFCRMGVARFCSYKDQMWFETVCGTLKASRRTRISDLASALSKEGKSAMNMINARDFATLNPRLTLLC